MSSALLPTFQKFENDAISQDIIESAAALCSTNYGVWGPGAELNAGAFAKPGRRVRMSAAKLRAECLPTGARTTYVRAKIGDELIGNVLACRWQYQGRSICWITQLVVSSTYRKRGVATRMLTELQEGEPKRAFGILSSHPAAILATLRAFGRGIEDVDLSMTQEHANAIMKISPVRYVHTATLRGSLFGNNKADGVISSANTNFWVDHQEPVEALEEVRKRGVIWPFGDLLEGHEYLVILEGQT
ncbi:hypothetical protein BU16DRAFT_572867 [Lophium mytilinum]|uniref:N-acetyltransferase domain-containing protein n=1 Tax=Lophium mytilinum TaxID=390894 RepID=A0A6A6QSZ2_9PEZI|nr:hypothetical protein BU16DRAFT_572867 [Lophium mytilinum]